MRLTFLVCSLLVALGFADAVSKLTLAEECNETLCKLPNCRCSSTNIPGGFQSWTIPQFVTITFDDNVNSRNIVTYRNLLYNRTNIGNGCPVGATFFVGHEYTDYDLVNELYNRGFEIGLNSITHRTSNEFWANATYNDLKEEIVDQRAQMAYFANISSESIQGVRLPFLQMTGNTGFQVMADYGLLYDSSWPTNAYMNPGLWPYTLDYKSIQDCSIPPCPTASIPKPWVLPMVSWTDLSGTPCGMIDNCFHIPRGNDTEGWYELIVKNFLRHFQGNRAPFGIHVHEWFLTTNPGLLEALEIFISSINKSDDVFVVNAAEVIEYVKNPVLSVDYRKKACRTRTSTSCARSFCGPVPSEHNEINYWMNVCGACPRVYPWVGNPYGL